MSKFINLKREYKDFINYASSEIKKIKIDGDLLSEDCINIIFVYDKLYNKIIEDRTININDINHIMLNYNKENTDVELLKKFIKIKNTCILKIIVNSVEWDKYIDELTNKYAKLSKNKLLLRKYVTKGLFNIIASSINKFRGCWEIVTIANNKVKKIEIVEPSQNENLLKYISNKVSQ